MSLIFLWRIVSSIQICRALACVVSGKDIRSHLEKAQSTLNESLELRKLVFVSRTLFSITLVFDPRRRDRTKDGVKTSSA
eukprot:763133-Hanusia_phi.AAC.4